MSDTPAYVKPEDAGHWDGDRFIFDHPLIMRDQYGRDQTMRVLDCSRMQLDEGITREDVLHALLNPEHVDEPSGFTCPCCQRTSYHPDDISEGYCVACHDWTREET